MESETCKFPDTSNTNPSTYDPPIFNIKFPGTSFPPTNIFPKMIVSGAMRDPENSTFFLEMSAKIGILPSSTFGDKSNDN